MDAVGRNYQRREEDREVKDMQRVIPFSSATP
jgi:hypothetical protein